MTGGSAESEKPDLADKHSPRFCSFLFNKADRKVVFYNLSLSLIVSSFCVPVNLPMSQLPPYKACQERGVTDDYQAEDDKEAGEKSKREKPEPKENVNLLVDNVDRQKAEGVVGLT